MKVHLFYFSFLVTFSQIVFCEDFYELLGVTKQSTKREIRQAFKKLALVKHPDKNKDDPDANQKFLRLNRAYEVLKDDDLRKKYDMHGEAGLSEDKQQGGRGFHSWNFYNQQFGIYDDDPEIITLSKSDFDVSVDGSGDLWFINFYSVHCSHCHNLAPTWRELARDLEGVIRIGAINCADDRMLCHMQGVHSYPTLIMYPSKEKYFGDRVTPELVRFALKNVKASVNYLWPGNFEATINEEETKHLPWLITYCGEDGDCLSKKTATKLSVMLENLVNIGIVNCDSNANLCNRLGHTFGTFYYDASTVETSKGMEITSLDAKEVLFSALSQLSEMIILNNERLSKILKNLKEGLGHPWLLHFVEGDYVDLELRKLPALLKSTKINVGRVDCRVTRTICNQLHVTSFPKFAAMKIRGGLEFHHGRSTAQDVAAFAKDSSQTPVIVLGPGDFPDPVVDGSKPWFVDFYAPWCPPCMRLLPEFRKASKMADISKKINFGTVDCTIHTSLCQQYNIRSYPSTILFNLTKPNQFQGQHNAQTIIEFLQDAMNPPVLNLDEPSFDALVNYKSADEMVMVDFFAPWCGPCQQLAPEWRRLAKNLADAKNIKVAQVDCQSHRNLCQKNKVKSYPTIRLYPIGTSGSDTHHAYSGWHRDAQSLRAWAYEFLPSSVTELSGQTFQQRVVGSDDMWVVDFYAPWCGHCQVFAPEFEKVAQHYEGRIHAGKVNCDAHGWVCQQAGVRAYPSVRFYRGHSKDMFGSDLNSQNGDYIIQYLKQFVSKHDEL